MRRFPILISQIAFIASSAAQAQASVGGEQLQVPAELWDRPRTGQLVLAIPSIRQTLNAQLAAPGARLTVHHPPGAESAAQAEELRAWLVAHAVELARVVLRGDLQARQPLQLEVGK